MSLEKWYESDPDWIRLGEIAYDRLHMQTQYAARYIRGRGTEPGFGQGLRFEGDPADYHDVYVHKDDLEEFVTRVTEHLVRTGQR